MAEYAGPVRLCVTVSATAAEILALLTPPGGAESVQAAEILNRYCEKLARDRSQSQGRLGADPTVDDVIVMFDPDAASNHKEALCDMSPPLLRHGPTTGACLNT